MCQSINHFNDYKVNQKGEVFSFKRGSKYKLKARCNNEGYYYVVLYGFTILQKSIHRLVAETFILNPYNLPIVNHIDGDTSNNHIDNLEWTTVKGNIHNAMERGVFQRGERNGYSKLTEKEVIEMRKRYLKNNITQAQLAKEYNVSAGHINNIIHKRVWGWL